MRGARASGSGPIVAGHKVSGRVAGKRNCRQGTTVGGGEFREGGDLEVLAAPVEPQQVLLADQGINEDVHQETIVGTVEAQG
ncbi:unnamed protein product, partial [Cylindrotheca closterium]